jgi:Domain of unknown function (DUF397)
MGTWRKSSYSDANGGSCVELADDSCVVLVRDTTDRSGTASGTAALVFGVDTWARFTASMK